MATTIADVMSVLDDLLLQHFKAKSASTGTNAPFLAFEVGTPMPDEMFRVPPASAHALEYMSHHANTVPQVHDTLFERTGNTIDGLYQILLFGSSPVDAASMELLGHIKEPATDAFGITLGSLQVPEERFHPTHADPENWFDQSSDNWTTLKIDRGNNPPATQVPKSLDPRLLRWQLASDAERPLLAAPVSTQNLKRLAMLQRADVSALAVTPPPAAPRPTVTAQAMVRPRPDQTEAFVFERPATAQRMAFAPAQRFQVAGMAGPAAAHTVIENPPVIQPHPTTPPERSTPPEPGTPTTPPPGEQPPVSSDNFSVSVDVCVVNLRRPWLSDALLNLKGWGVPTFAKGAFSGGTGAGDPGKFSVLPIACILIRNLVIKAQWSEQDQEHIETSKKLGSFSLLGRHFDKTTATLTVPGMQSAAWICDPLPVLPPADMPA